MQVDSEFENVGYTQEGLAAEVGVGQRSIARWEAEGLDKASVKDVIKISLVLGCTLDDLLKTEKGELYD